MSKTQLTGSQILNNSVVRADINIATTGSALITKLVAGTNVTITSTGADIGTGDVTVNAAGTTSLLSVFGRTGVVVKVAGDYNFTDLAGLLPLSQMPAFTGDITSSAGSTLTTLPTVNSNIGTFNSFTVNAKGFITAATLTTTLITSPLSSTVLSSYPDASSYYGNATTANGWPINGTLTGSRFATAGTQRLQGILSSSQYIRSWDATNLVWRVWVPTVDSGDYTGKGVILAGTATNTYSGLLSGADGLALSASSAATTGLAYSAMSIANGGTGATTAAAGLTNLGLTPLNSPAFTGNPTAPNPPNGDISSAIVTTAFVQRATNAVSTITLPTSGNINGNTAQLLVPS